MEGVRRRKLALTAALALVAFGAMAPLARADDSQIRISEVYSDGSVAKGDYVELQLMASGQQIGPSRLIRAYAANGTPSPTILQIPDFALPASESQRTVLLGWDSNPNVDVGFSTFPIPPLTGGAVCFLDSVTVAKDCVSWGNFTGSIPGATGAPAPALNANQSLTRTEARGCPTLLDAPDDTDNSAADFSLQSPSPRNNLALPSETPCTTPATTTPLKKCKKKKKKGRAAEVAKKRCKKKKKS